MKRVFGAAFVLSLGLNAFLVYENCFGHPDVDFYPTSLRDAYYVKGYTHGTFTIDHKGHRFTTECRASLTWLDGTNSPGRPMSNGECTYMESLVGKSIAAGLMRQENDNLVYTPWATSDTLQTANILTIIRDETK